MKYTEPRFANATAADLGIRPFAIPSCTRCRGPLADAHGNPRWEIVGVGLSSVWVCLGGCRRPAWQSRARKAALS